MKGRIIEISNGIVKIKKNDGEVVEVNISIFNGEIFGTQEVVELKTIEGKEIWCLIREEKSAEEVKAKKKIVNENIKNEIKTDLKKSEISICSIICVIVGVYFIMNGSGFEVNSAVHQIYQSMQYILGVLWFILAGVFNIIKK